MLQKATDYFNWLAGEYGQDYSNIFISSGKKSSGKVKTVGITSYRYQKNPDYLPGGEHLTVLVADNGELSGYVNMTREAVSDSLPGKESAKETALEFLQRYAPDLIPDMKINWIDRHDENFSVDGKKYTVSGMKMKCRSAGNGTYFWVVVGSLGQILTFERDIEWDFIKAGRQTEKWLHDDWLVSKKIDFTKQ